MNYGRISLRLLKLPKCAATAVVGTEWVMLLVAITRPSLGVVFLAFAHMPTSQPLPLPLIFQRKEIVLDKLSIAPVVMFRMPLKRNSYP